MVGFVEVYWDSQLLLYKINLPYFTHVHWLWSTYCPLDSSSKHKLCHQNLSEQNHCPRIIQAQRFEDYPRKGCFHCFL